MSKMLNNVVLIDGVRTAFLRSSTDFALAKPHRMVAQCIEGLMKRLSAKGVASEHVEMAYGGIGAENSRATNMMRHAMIDAGLPATIHAVTMSNVCLSGFSATAAAFDAVQSGRVDGAMVGAAEFCSTMPVRVRPHYESVVRAANSNMKKSLNDEMKINLINGFKTNSFLPDDPFAYIRETTTGYRPGDHAEKANQFWKVPRKDQDEFAYKSHMNATQSVKEGKFDNHLLEVKAPLTIKGPEEHPVSKDNGILSVSFLQFYIRYSRSRLICQPWDRLYLTV